MTTGEPTSPIARVPLGALAVCVACVAALLVYWNSFSVPLLLDDVTTIVNNPSIRQLSPLSAVLFPPPEIYSAGRPLLNLSFALNYTAGKTAVSGYHAVNLVIHVCAGLAFFGLVRRTLLLPRMERFHHAATAIAAVTALVWLVHPVQTASVTYISQRAESLMGMFYLLTLYGFIRGATMGGVSWFVLSVLACACAMVTKEVAVTAPVIALLFDRQFISGSFRAAWTRHRGYYLALASTWLILIALMISSQLTARGIGLGHSLDRLNYLRIESVAVLKYLQLSVWPHPLVFDYGPQVPIPSAATSAACALAIATLLGASFVAFRRSLPVGFTGLAFFLLLAPTSSFVPVAGQPIAENRIYLPSAAVIATGIAWAYLTLGRRGRWTALVAVLGLGWAAHGRNTVFQSEIAVWKDSAEKRLTNARAWTYLSIAYAQAGRLNEAITVLRTAVAHLPRNPELQNNLGVFLYQAGQPPAALEALRTAVRLKPEYDSAWQSLARISFEIGDFPGAIEGYQHIIRFAPRNAEAHNFLGVALFRVGRTAEAAEHFRTAVTLKPDFTDAKNNLAAMLALPK